MKIYRVTVRWPRPYTDQRVKVGTSRMVSATWNYYLDELRAAERAGWDMDRAVFKVEVGNVQFTDISALYDAETELAAK